jgi:hypothetical protein
MAIHAIDNAAFVGKRPKKNCVTANLPIDLSVEKQNIIKSIRQVCNSFLCNAKVSFVCFILLE